ncbi:nucleotide-binding protein YvcJ [Muribaculaceae bacterium]|jgi:aminoglycoside/choline kinase family phosphotransferase|nr:phosphotransferase [Muribaculaceae bacterium]GFI05545.1 nucleotide-binding protein YvcJ [Muribaculaceae bacterium]
MQRLKSLIPDAKSFEPITGSGSNRRYWRVVRADGTSVIGAIGTVTTENDAFIYLSGYFSSRDLPVPRILAVSPDRTAYVQEDLGDTCLLDRITDTALVAKTIDMLPRFQINGALGLDFSRCHPVPEMDMTSVMWDLNYFKYCYLKLTGLEIDEPRLEKEFQSLASCLLMAKPWGFMVRDFQSRNVMIRDNMPYLIDFQGGRRGPVHYDVASFLWQARAGLSAEFRNSMVERYIAASGVDAEEFRTSLPFFVIFRMLQVLGAYGFRGYHERKPAFMQQIPAALTNLREAMNPAVFPYLSEITDTLLSRHATHSSVGSDNDANGILTVEVLSFSYKKGLPADMSGNGGGFVFDCRAIHNPGRYEPYKQLTGKDAPVAEFLENDGEVFTFLDHCCALVDHAVERYLKRGFTHLQIAFGCTGGQHRSVYCAAAMAARLREKFAGQPIAVTETHREQPSLRP